MAHKDACKIQTTQLMKKLVDRGLPVTQASEITGKESDIPPETIRRWWYEAAKETQEIVFKNEQSHPNSTNDCEIPNNQVVEYNGEEK